MTDHPLTPAQLAGMAQTAATGASRFGKLDFWAACLAEEAERTRLEGPRPSSYDPRESER